MCCLLNCNNQNPQNVIRIVGPRGPRGPMGPQGINNAVYGIATAQTVVAGGNIPLIQSVATTPSSITVNNGIVTLPIGVYSITYGVDATSAIDVDLTANGAPVSNITATAPTAGGTASTQKTLLYNATAPTNLALINGGTADLTLTSGNISVIKLQ